MWCTPVEGPDVWTGAELRADPNWILDLSDADQAEALAALQRLSGRTLDDIDLSDVELPTLGRKLDSLIDQIEGGRGVALIRGAPLEGLDEARIAKLFWALSLWLGYPEAQDGAGKRLHHVKAERSFQTREEAQEAFQTTNMRGYQTNLELTFHGDGSDALFFLCVHPASEGGLSRVLSAGAVFNRILRERPDLAEALQRPFPFDARGELGPDRPFQVSPIFVHYKGMISMLYKRGYIDLAGRIDGAPDVSTKQVEAMNFLDEVLRDPDLYFEFRMERGDILIANNYNVLHARTAFAPEPEGRPQRHMMRIWSTLRRNRRPLPTPFRTTREFGGSHRRRLELGDQAPD